MFNSESKNIYTRNVKRTHGTNTKQLCGLKENHLFVKLIWNNLQFFSHSDGSIRLRSEADEVMYPSCLVPTAQVCRGSVMIWGWFSWSGLGSATLCAQKNEVSRQPECTGIKAEGDFRYKRERLLFCLVLRMHCHTHGCFWGNSVQTSVIWHYLTHLCKYLLLVSTVSHTGQHGSGSTAGQCVIQMLNAAPKFH